MADLDRAYAELDRRDPVLRRLIRRAGRPDPFAWPGAGPAGEDLFAGLVLHVVGQQISVPVALSVFGRLSAASGAPTVTAAALAELDVEQLRATGLSAAKGRALTELAAGVRTGAVDLESLRHVDDEEAVATLTALRGIGPWTAQMFLIHQLRRPDVLPIGDVGIREAVQRAFGLDQRPSAEDVGVRGAGWAPHRSFAAALLWASLHAA